jgi:hypothetical protein
MDQETKQPSADTNTSTNANQSPSADSSGGGKSPTMEQLMQKSPALSPLCGWLKCLRKPALSMQYSIQKRHIPDLDTRDTRDTRDSGQKATTKQEQSAPAAKGQTSDVMDVTRGFTIRYFDFALGILGLMVAGILVKGGCRLKKKL